LLLLTVGGLGTGVFACSGTGFTAAAGSGGTGGGSKGGAGGVAQGGGAGAVGGATSGGSGGACSRVDADGDGQDPCSGDCDDTDPDNFTGNTEICGDLKDNNCNMAADEQCGGLGTFVSTAIGNDANPGTRTQPVATIAKGISNGQTIRALRSAPIDVFVAQGHYGEKVLLVGGVSLIGGHQCDVVSCTWTRDPPTYDTAILAQDNEGLTADDTITRATSVAGFRIMGQDGPGVPGSMGRAAVTLAGGSPTFEADRIFAPSVTSGGWPEGRSFGILIVGPTNSSDGALIENCQINVDRTGQAIFGQTPIGGAGVGFEGQALTSAAVRKNLIRGADGKNSTGIALWSSAATTRIEFNDISAGNAPSDAYGIVIGAKGLINANTINVSTLTGSCSGTTGWCGGILSESATFFIVNNVVKGMRGAQSAAVRLAEFEQPAGRIVLNSNLLDGVGKAGGISTAINLTIGIGMGLVGHVGEIRNNILIGGLGDRRFGVYEDPAPGKTQHPDALESNLFWVVNSGTGTGALYRFYDSALAVPEKLFTQIVDVNNNLAPLILTPVTIGSNLNQDPKVDATFHLLTGSPAVDMATPTDAPTTDMDAESRPMGAGFDIGPDEAQ
jgi:hypothetical protein